MSGEERDGLSAAIIFSPVCDRSCLADRRHQTEHNPSLQGGDSSEWFLHPTPFLHADTQRHFLFSFHQLYALLSTICSATIFIQLLEIQKQRGNSSGRLLGSGQDLWIASRHPTVSLQGSRIAKIFQSEFSQIQILRRSNLHRFLAVRV